MVDPGIERRDALGEAGAARIVKVGDRRDLTHFRKGTVEKGGDGTRITVAGRVA